MPLRLLGSRVAALALSAISLTLGAAPASAQTTVVTSQVNPGGAIERGSCVSIAIKADYGGTWQCGDLIWSHPLPATTTMGKVRQPTWRFSLDQGAAIFSVGANVATTASGANQLRAVATFWQRAPNSTPLDSAAATTVWSSAWSTGAARRVNIGALLPDLPTGAYAYTFFVTFLDSTTMTTIATAHDTGTIGVVNRQASPYGPGLWLDGIEMLSFRTPDTTQLFWVAGDGSARLYTHVASGTWVVTPAVDRPDTLVAITGGYRRHLPNGAYVEFDNYGHQVATRNAQGQITHFYPDTATGRLDSLVLAVPGGSGAHLAYTFAYASGAGGAITTTVTPPPVGATARTAKAVWSGSGGLAFDFYDPDDIYPKGELRVFSNDAWYLNLNESGYGTQVGFDYGNEVSETDVTLTVGVTVITQRFCAAEYASLTDCQNGWTGVTDGVPVLVDSVRTWYVGPRDSVDTYGDTLSIHVNAFGAPTKITDALGNVTTVQYSDTFPLLAVETIGPTGTTARAAYNGRALFDSTWVVGPYGGANAVTSYTWDASLNVLTHSTDPTGGTDSLAYDGSGNLLWQQDGRGSSSRVRFAYNADNQVDSVQPPGNSSAQMIAYAYDSLGDLASSKTPIGFVTQHYTDAVGRDTLVLTPTDSAQTSGLRTKHRTIYDLMNRVTETDDIGAATTYSIVGTDTVKQNTLRVTTSYDGPGRVTEIDRADVELATLADWQTFTYDQTGRQIASDGGVAGRHGYAYDLAGNLVADSTPRGYVLTQGYDADNQLLWKVTPGITYGQYYTLDISGNSVPWIWDPYFGATVIPRDSAVFTYDSAGNLLAAQNNDAVVRRTYYPGGALKTDSTDVLPYVPAGATTKYGITSFYDLAGRRDSLTLPSALLTCSGTCVQHMGYNLQTGTLDTVMTFKGETFSWQVDAAGRDTTESMPDGSTQRWTYDIDGRRATRVDTGTAVTHTDSYRFDARGLSTERATTSATWAGHPGENLTVASVYSGLGAAVAMHTDLSAMSLPNAFEEWQMDASGTPYTYSRNRGNTIGSTFDATTPVSGTMSGSGDGRFGSTWLFDSLSTTAAMGLTTSNEFDNSGNIVYTSRIAGQYNGMGGYSVDTTSEVEYWYGANEQLRAVMTFGNDWVAGNWSTYNENRYDAFGRLVFTRSRVLPLGATDWASYGAVSAAHRFIWDGNQLLGEVRVPGDTAAAASDSLDTDDQALASGSYFGTVAYVNGPVIDAPLAMNWSGNGDSTLVLHTSGAGYFDAGTTVAGAFCCTTIPFPASTALAYGEQAVPTTFPGWAGSMVAEQQDESGLMYRRNRWYSPSLGQFTQGDPAGLAGGANFYGYAGGDPVNFRDTFGTCKVQVGYAPLAGGAFYHTYLILTDPSSATVYTAGSTGNVFSSVAGYSQLITLHATEGSSLDPESDNEATDDKATISNDDQSCDNDKNILNPLYADITSLQYAYDVRHLNSNSVTATGLAALHIHQQWAHWAPGSGRVLRSIADVVTYASLNGIPISFFGQ